MRAIADTIFPPIKTMLNTILTTLDNISVNMVSGLDLDYYLSPIALMGTPWVFLVKSLILCVVAFIAFTVAKTGYSLYLQIKQGVQWW